MRRLFSTFSARFPLKGSWEPELGRFEPEGHLISSIVDRLSSIVDRLSTIVDRLSTIVDRLSSIVDRLSSRCGRLSTIVDRLSSRCARLSRIFADPRPKGVPTRRSISQRFRFVTQALCCGGHASLLQAWQHSFVLGPLAVPNGRAGLIFVTSFYRNFDVRIVCAYGIHTN